jgi:prevent-host-death family protein
MSDGTWTVDEAEAKFSQIIEEAETHGPQTVTRDGRSAVVVVSAEEWERKTKPKGTLADFLAASPLRDSGIDLTRIKDEPRDIDL